MKWVHISRPRFWLMTAIPYSVGVVAGDGSILSLYVLLHILLFLIPVNIFTYALNDYFDKETDWHNPVKRDSLHADAQLIGWSSLFCALGLFLQTSFASLLLYVLFFLILIAYNVSPIRLKSVPYLDVLCSFRFVLPGILGYFHVSSSFPSFLVIFSATLWFCSMYLLFSLRDIKPDTKAGVYTSAVLFGYTHTLVITCFLLFIAGVAAFFILPILSLFFLFYLLASLLLLFFQEYRSYFQYLGYVNNILAFIVLIMLF
ncbi:MAG: UbiA family prenyltransferase [Candidatus Woesearchaeota archaeon]